MITQRNLKVYQNSYDTIGTFFTLNVVIQHIRDGRGGLADKTERCNALAITDKREYKKYKESKLPAATFSGTFTKDERKAHLLLQHSGLVTIDIDGLNPAEMGYLLTELSQIPVVLLAFVSPSGAGIKAIVSVDPIPANHIEHKGAYQECLKFFNDLATEHEFQIDTSGSDCSRLCYLAHYPQAIVRENPIPIKWDREGYLALLEAQEVEHTDFEYDGEVDIKALNYIDADDYDTWTQVGMACYRAGLPMSVWVKWSQKSEKSAENKPGEYEKHWRTFTKPKALEKTITWGTVVHWAKENGYVPKCPSRTEKVTAIREGRLSPLAIYRKPVKLTKTHGQTILDTLAKSQEHIAKILRLPARVIGFRADTGTGKNYQTENYALNEGAILVNVPTGDLAIDLETRMINRLSDANLPRDYVFRRRGLMHRWNDGKDAHLRFPHEIPCIQAARCDAYRKKGGNMYKGICPDCPVEAECIREGYRSQLEQSKNALMVITSHPDLHINPAHRTFAKPYLTYYTGEKRLVVQDDVSADKLFLECSVTRQRLQQMRDDWEGVFLGIFAKELLRLLEVEDRPWAIGDYLNTLTEEQKELLNFQLTRVRIQTRDAGTLSHFVMTLDEAIARGFYSNFTEADIEEMPAVYPKKWTLLNQLTAFFDHYKREADAPLRYHNGTLSFALPPRLHDNVWKAVFMSATLDPNLFKSPFPEAHTQDLVPTQFTEGAKIYQLRTNRNPRATVYQFADGTPTGLNAAGEEYWQMMIDEINHTPDTQHAIITYKQVLEWKANAEASDLSELDNITATAHYGNLVGLDTDFKKADVLWVLFTPDIPHGEKIPNNVVTWWAKVFFGNDPDPLNYEFDNETGQYKDKRLQKVWENFVIGELIQASGRGRPVRKPIIVVILSSHFIPGITDRAETKLFDEADWEIAGGLDGLDDAIAKREEFEKRAAALTAENTIADFQEVRGCSKRHARRLWEQAGGSDVFIAAVLELSQTHLIRKTAEKLGCSRGKVESILRKHKVS